MTDLKMMVQYSIGSIFPPTVHHHPPEWVNCIYCHNWTLAACPSCAGTNRQPVPGVELGIGNRKRHRPSATLTGITV